MGLSPSCLRVLIRMHGRLRFHDPLLCLGNPDVWADGNGLRGMFRAEGVACREPSRILPHSSDTFRRFIPERAKEFVHARTLFEMMGLSDYSDIDKFDFDDPVILHDLNEPVPAELHERFGLVLDAGTIEHIFDVRRVMENIVRMTQVGGRVLHQTPSSNYVDHSLYSFSPTFFYDFYRANGFDDFVCYLVQLHPRDTFRKALVLEYSYGMPLEGLLDGRRRLVVSFSARKTRSCRDIVVPTQGFYAELAASPETEAVKPAPRKPSPLRSAARVLPLPLRRGIRNLREWLFPKWRHLERI